MTVSNAAQAGVDRTDIADTMGHTAMELTARASMAAGATGAYAVGHAAGRTRDVMTRPQRAMVAVYKAEEKTARQLDRALRKGKPGAARAKRVADARKRAGKPIVLSDAKPSARIGGFAAKGKASRRIGKHVGGGLKKAGRGVKRLGSTGLDWMDCVLSSWSRPLGVVTFCWTSLSVWSLVSVPDGFRRRARAGCVCP